MSADPFESVEVPDDAPELPPWQEWVVPKGHPDRRFAVTRVPDDASPLIREGLVRRRIQAVGGVCPCGGRVQWPDEDGAMGVIQRVLTPHRLDCPANDAVLVPAIRAYTERLERE